MTIATAASAFDGAGEAVREAAETTLVGFARALRAAGLPVSQDRTQAFLTAVAAVGLDDPGGVYWAGRATLTAEPDHFRALRPGLRVVVRAARCRGVVRAPVGAAAPDAGMVPQDETPAGKSDEQDDGPGRRPGPGERRGGAAAPGHRRR